MYDSLYTSSRVESFTVDVLDKNDQKIYTLGEVTGGTISSSVDARIKTAGKVEISTRTPIDWWGTYRLQIWAHANSETWSLGVFIPSSPIKQHSGDTVRMSVEISDKLAILDQDATEAPLSIPAGTQLTAWVTNYIHGCGETNVNITPSDRFNKRPLTWDAGTSKLTVINDILDYAGYFSLLSSPNGQYVATPYIVPAQRPITWRFGENQHSLTSRDFTFTQDLDAIPNKAVYIVQSASTVVNGVTIQGTVTAAPMVAVATNTDPASPFSYPSRGRWVTRVSTDVEADSQEELQKMVETFLDNAQEPHTKVEFSTAIFPMQLNELARFTTHDYDLVGSIRKTEYNLRAPSLMNVTIQKSNYELS